MIVSTLSSLSIDEKRVECVAEKLTTINDANNNNVSERMIEKQEHESLNVESQFDSADYAMILSYLEKFGHYLFPKSVDIQKLEAYLMSSEKISRKLRDFHIKLLRNLNSGRGARKQNWESYLAKFIGDSVGAEQIEELKKKGYSSLPLNLRLQIIKNLFEAQLDENSRLRQKYFNDDETLDSNEMRSQPVGRDQNSLVFWLFIDAKYTFRLFTESLVDNKWKLIARDENELESVMNSLRNSTSSSSSASNDGETKKSKRIRKPTQTVDMVMTSKSSCLKCGKKTGQKQVTCQRCHAVWYHESCFEEATSSVWSHETQWLCKPCEHSQLIENLDVKFNEIKSNMKRRVLFDSDDGDESSESSSDEATSQREADEPMEIEPKKPVINFDSPIKEGQKRSCRLLNKIKYRFEEEDEGHDEEEEEEQEREATSDREWEGEEVVSESEEERESTSTSEKGESATSKVSEAHDHDSHSPIKEKQPKKLVFAKNRVLKRRTSDENRERLRKQKRQEFEYEFGFQRYNEDDYFNQDSNNNDINNNQEKKKKKKKKEHTDNSEAEGRDEDRMLYTIDVQPFIFDRSSSMKIKIAIF